MKCKSVGAFKWLSVVLVIAVMITAVMITSVGCGKKETVQPTITPGPTAAPTATIPAEPTGETGTLSGLEGGVQVQRPGASAWAAATSGMRVGEGYSVKTGSDGYALITFFDGSVMELEADTEITIEELSEASGGATTVRINQVIGNTVNRVQNLVDSSSTYEVTSPAGSAVVRGTIFNMLVGLYGNLHRACVDTWYEGDGTQHSTDFSGGGGTVNVPGGKTSCCWEGGVPSQPFYTDPGDDPYQGGGGCYGYGCGAQPTPTPTCVPYGGQCDAEHPCCMPYGCWESICKTY